nr:GIY-YIG nuclease family protein [Rothia aeria]
MLRNSFLKRLVEDEHSTVIVPNETLNETNLLKDEGVTGTLYVLRTLSNDPQVSGYPNLHKIGYTTTSLEKRLARAPFEPAYLNAPVEVVASYTLYGLNVGKVEKTMHRLFAPARLSIKQTAANGQSINIVEWFDVPLPVIDKAVDLLGKNQLHGYSYDRGTQQLVKH